MAYVIVNTCENDDVCAPSCPEEAISHGEIVVDGVEYNQYFIDATKCSDCGACESVCPTESIYSDLDLAPKEKHFVAVSAAFFAAQ